MTELSTSMICKGSTKLGAPCRAKAGSSGYCPKHDPAKIEEREKVKREQEAARKIAEAKQEAARKIAEAKYERLQKIVDVIKRICQGKGWKVYRHHFDKESGRYATLNIERTFYRGDSYDNYEKVTATIDITVHKNGDFRYALQPTSFYDYGLKDLIDTIKFTFGQSNSSLKKNVENLEQPLSQSTTSQQALSKLEFLLKRFHRAAHQLTQRHNSRQTLIIKDEYDVQDLLHALLLVVFDDVRSEDPLPIHAGKASRLDFFLKEEKIMIEVKMTRETLRDDKIGEQLIVDIERYRARSDCQVLVCFVYDPGHYLKTPRSLENDLSRKHDQLTVKVIVYSP